MSMHIMVKRLPEVPKRIHVGPVEGSGIDADGVEHRFTINERRAGLYVLEDPVRRIRTLSMRLSDVNCGPRSLPGGEITSTSTNFESASAIIAHANAARVYDFFSDELQR